MSARATSRAACALILVMGTAIAERPARAAEEAEEIVVGARALTVVDARRGREIEVELSYPARGHATLEPHVFVYAVRAARGAPFIDETPRPLVVLSHGTGGTPYDMAWLARALVLAGFVVAAPAHPGDTFGDASILRALETWQRPQDVTAVLDALLSHRELRRHIDTSRIAVVGHSAGGYTALATVGATYSIANAEKKCRVAVGDPTCDLVKPVDRSSIDYSRSHESYADPRVRAAVALAPAVGEAATPETAARVRVPVLIIGAQKDQLALFDGHARHWASLIPTSTLDTRDDGDHYQFVTPCMPYGPLVADACEDPPGFDRARVQTEMATRIVRFIEDSLLADVRQGGAGPDRAGARASQTTRAGAL